MFDAEKVNAYDHIWTRMNNTWAHMGEHVGTYDLPHMPTWLPGSPEEGHHGANRRPTSIRGAKRGPQARTSEDPGEFLGARGGAKCQWQHLIGWANRGRIAIPPISGPLPPVTMW